MIGDYWSSFSALCCGRELSGNEMRLLKAEAAERRRLAFTYDAGRLSMKAIVNS